MTVPGVYAKSPQGGRSAELLTDHLGATFAAVGLLRQRLGRLSAGDVVDGGFWAAAMIAAICHDLGKVPEGFQAMIAGRVRAWGPRHEVLSLGFLPGLVADERQRTWVGSAVLTHHRSLSGSPRSIAARYAGIALADLAEDLGPIDDQAVCALQGWVASQLTTAGLPPTATAPPSATASVPSIATDQSSIVAGLRRPAPNEEHLSCGQRPAAVVVAAAHRGCQYLLERWADDVDPDTGLAAVLLQGAVTLADHLSSAHQHRAWHTRQPVDDSLLPRLADRLGGVDRLHPHQQRCAQADGHLLLRAPTGSGKTEAGLLWAARQVLTIAAATGGVPRVVVTLPYLASINAMADRLADLLDGADLVGVAHSRAASYHLAAGMRPDETDPDDPDRAAAVKAVSRAAATRLFRETVRVATPYQLLRAALAGPAHAGILVELANSVIVLDELHAYDPRRLGYILASAALWERLGCRVGVLSATLPTALADLLAGTLAGPVTTVQGPSGRPRHRVRMRGRSLTDPATVAEIADRLRSGRSVLVVANTVADAQHLFDELAPPVRRDHGTDAAILLHSRFKRQDRQHIEERLVDRYRASVTPRHPGLVVATQTVEVSLDLDLDLLYTCGAPLEALIQRFGRVNRRGDRPPTDVVICPPAYGPRPDLPASGPYADGVYPAEPVRLGMAILARHDGQPVDEVQATAWLTEVYDGDWGRSWRATVDTHRRAFSDLFLAFARPYDARDDLEERFDELFEGAEAILASDYDAYARQLGAQPRAADRLLGEQYLIPIPGWAIKLSKWDRKLRVRIVDGDYDEQRGLLAIRPVSAPNRYQAGEVL